MKASSKKNRQKIQFLGRKQTPTLALSTSFDSVLEGAREEEFSQLRGKFFYYASTYS